MSHMESIAKAFFEACETGKGWSTCQAFCTPGATFSCQADALAEVRTLQAYTDWMKGLFTPIPNGAYTLTAWGVDNERHAVVAAAVFTGSQTGEGGPVPPTGMHIEADYAYVMQFEGDKIRHMKKIWNANFSLKQLGWA
ncbi:MAG: nuclear transport factor 2 family protein [Hyphomicrobiaceae bacterium]